MENSDYFVITILFFNTEYDSVDEDESEKRHQDSEESVEYENRNDHQKIPCTEELNICEHICYYTYYMQESEPRIECSCHPGYFLDEADGRSCVNESINGKMKSLFLRKYFSSFDFFRNWSIWRILS